MGRPRLYPEIETREDAEGNEIIFAKLPPWLDDHIFGTLGARFGIAGETLEFDENLTSSEDKVLTYLGTYFPRSFLETFMVFDSILAEWEYRDKLKELESFSVVSVGSGTGGDALGLILALRKAVPSCKRFKVVSFEGNASAHAILRDIFAWAAERLKIEIAVDAIDLEFPAADPFAEAAGKLEDGAYQFVITSKMLNELAKLDPDTSYFKEFLEAFAPKLDELGLLAMIEVTRKVTTESNQWLPVMMNAETNGFLATHGEYATVVPVLCNGHERDCEEGCYAKFEMKIQHSQFEQGHISKSCVRVIGHKGVADLLAGSPYLRRKPLGSYGSEKCTMGEAR